MTIKLQESLRGIFYAPFYAALVRGAYRDVGVEVEFVSAPTPGAAGTNIQDGVADVCWGGPMRVMQTYHNVPGCDLVCFGEVVTRDPFLLVGPIGTPRIAGMADLAALTLGTVSEVPTPWMCLQHDFREAGIDPASIRRIPDRSMRQNTDALLAGTPGFVAQLFEPFVSEALESGLCRVLYAGAHRGPTSYTTFYARRHMLTDRRDELGRMVKAIAATLHWVSAATGKEIAATIQPYFADVPPARLAAACSRYKALGVWGATPVLPRAGYDRLKDSLVSGGFVNPGTPFETAVDNSLAVSVA